MTLRTALAMGADRAILVQTPDEVGAEVEPLAVDPRAVAAALELS